MTQEEILEYNKRCADIIGAKPCKDWQGKDGYEHPNWHHYQWSNRFQDNLELYSYRYSDLKFHSDWNWIKSILEKISSLNEDDFSDETQQAFEDLLDLSLFSSKESICESINNFIKTIK